MVCAGRLKAENVWKIIASLDEPLQTTAKILSAMPVTQVSVETLFSSMTDNNSNLIELTYDQQFCFVLSTSMLYEELDFFYLPPPLLNCSY